MKNIKQVIIMGDILRYMNGQTYNTPWLFPMFEYLINTFSDIPVIKMHNDVAENFVKEFYSAINIPKQNHYSWIFVYNMEPNENIIALTEEYFKDSLIIAFELHPVLQKAFDYLNMPYIKLMSHPIRYMNDIFLGITSSNKNTFERIKKYEIPENYYYKYAMFLKAEAGVKEHLGKLQIPADTAVFFAQTNKDCSLMKGEKVVSLIDYKDRFADICKKYSNVFYKIHPLESNKKIIRYVKSFNNVKILYPNDIKPYDLLSNENVKKCYSISSGALYEAKYFGKEIEYFLGQPFMFTNDYKTENYDFKNTFVPVYKEIWYPSFWADILQDYIPSEKPVPADITEENPSRLRRIIGLTWGYEDFNSVELRNFIKKVDNKFKNKTVLGDKILKFFVNLIPSQKYRKKIRNRLELK